MPDLCFECGQPDDQLVETDLGIPICPACMVPNPVNRSCDRCGNEVDFDTDKSDTSIDLDPPNDEPVALRHGRCRGLTDCAVCGRVVDLSEIGWQTITDGSGLGVVKAFVHGGRCFSIYGYAGAGGGPFG